jgi:hypothetical protein
VGSETLEQKIKGICDVLAMEFFDIGNELTKRLPRNRTQVRGHEDIALTLDLN